MHTIEIVVMEVEIVVDHLHVETLEMQVHPEADLEIAEEEEEEHVMIHRWYDNCIDDHDDDDHDDDDHDGDDDVDDHGDMMMMITTIIIIIIYIIDSISLSLIHIKYTC